MIYTWEIFVDDQSKGFVEAMTEYSAREKYYLKNGSASGYSGLAIDRIKAVRYN